MGELDCQIAVSESTRNALKSLKVGEQTYDSLLRKMIQDYEPDPPDPDMILEK